MFNIEQPANPLELLASHLGTGLVQQQTANRENKQVMDVLSKIGPDSSPFDAINAIEGSRVSPEIKARLGELYQNSYKLNTERSKYQQELSEKAEKKKNEEKANISEAKSLGIPVEEYSNYGQEYKKGLIKNKTTNPSKGAQSFLPVPKEYSDEIQRILKENPDSDADDLALSLDQAGIPRAFSDSFIQNRREKQDRELTQKGKDIDIHNSWAPYEKELRDNAERASKQLESIEDIRDAIKQGASDPWGLVNWARSFGPLGQTLSSAFQSAAQGQMGAALPNLIEGFRQLFGQRITDADLMILKDKLPDFGKTDEANEAILKVLSKYAKPLVEKYEIARDVKKKTGGYRPINYDELVEGEYEKSHKGEKNEKPARSLSEADLDYYLKISGDDPEKAAERARKDGFVW
jgi:hypothetical protein